MKSFYKLCCLIAILLSSICTYAQTDCTKEAEKDITEKKEVFETAKDLYEKEKKILDSLTTNLDEAAAEQLTKVRELKANANKIHAEIEVLREFYLLKGVSEEDLDSFFELQDAYKSDGDNLINQNTPSEDAKTYMVFGDDNIILKEDIIKDEKANSVLSDILKEDSKIHLGDFWIPKDGAEIPVTFKCNAALRKKMGRDHCEEKEEESPRYLKFKKVDLEIFEGSLVDIKVYLEGNGHVYLFENNLSASLLRFTKQANWFMLRNRVERTYRNEEDDFAGYEVKLADVLRYFSNSGRNFIPDDQILEFPKMIDGKQANEEEANIYELHQNSSLKNVLDLRTYTDFLGLFGESPNGIAQIEGHASFFVIPSRLKGTPISLFKKIKPYVSYARLDENDRRLIPQRVEDTGTSVEEDFEVQNGLDLLQKSYLDLGLKLDVFSFKIKKEYPFEVNTYGVVRYQIADLAIDQIEESDMMDMGGEMMEEDPTMIITNDSELNNYKTLGVGAGINFDFRRFKNFTFSHSIEFTRYNVSSFNNFENFRNPEDFWVFRNESEVAYHTGTNRNNSIFVRLKVFDNKNPDVDSNFFQFQFGYKFSLGLQRVQAKN